MQSELETIEQRQKLYDELGLSRIAPIIEEHMKPSVRIRTSPSTDSEIPVGASKFGGLPDLPPNVEWPWWQGDAQHHDMLEAYDAKYGRHEYAYLPSPLLFLAQINLAEIAYIQIDEMLPKQGILYFFAAVWLDDVGDEPPGTSNCKVIYFDGDLSTLMRTGLPEDLPDYMPFRGRDGDDAEGYVYEASSVDFSTQMTPLDQNSFEYRDIAISSSEYEALNALDALLDLGVDILTPLHLFLGNPQCLQWDIRKQCTKNFDDLTEALNWRQLLQMSSYSYETMRPNDINWQACGRGYFMIERDALLQGNFDNIKLVHHCG